MEQNVSETSSQAVTPLQANRLDRIANMIEQLQNDDRSQHLMSDIKEVFSVLEVAKLFGCSPETIRRAIRTGDLKAARIGKTYAISRIDVDAYYIKKGGQSLFKE